MSPPVNRSAERSIRGLLALLGCAAGCAAGSPRRDPAEAPQAPTTTGVAPQAAPTAPMASASAAPPASASASAAPGKPPRVEAAAAKRAAEGAFTKLTPALPPGTKLSPLEPTLEGNVWKIPVVYGEDTTMGTLLVDGESGAILYESNDGSARREAIDAFVARFTEEARIVDIVARHPTVKSLCARVRAQKLACSISFEERPSGDDCGPSAALASSCWMRVLVQEVGQSHGSKLGSFLVDPRTMKVVGAAGYCDPVPIARFNGPGSGCPK